MQFPTTVNGARGQGSAREWARYLSGRQGNQDLAKEWPRLHTGHIVRALVLRHSRCVCGHLENLARLSSMPRIEAETNRGQYAHVRLLWRRSRTLVGPTEDRVAPPPANSTFDTSRDAADAVDAAKDPSPWIGDAEGLDDDRGRDAPTVEPVYTNSGLCERLAQTLADDRRTVQRELA